LKGLCLGLDLPENDKPSLRRQGTLRKIAVAELSPEKLPRRFTLVAALPYNPSGKLLRRKIDPAIFDDTGA